MRIFYIAIAFVVLFLSFAPEDRLNAVKVTFNRIIYDPGQLCFDLRSKDLKDKETARITKVDVEKDIVTVEYRAKNGFGTFDNGAFTCKTYGQRLPNNDSERNQYTIDEFFINLERSKK
ncbi:MAG: hypothetical protein KGZ37_06600 [Nitrosarchaeum sp.]|nr:hypothetical protein [Nitrosarchaeum sp.]